VARILIFALLLFASSLVIAQQPAPPQPTAHPQDKSEANSKIRSHINDVLRSDPSMSGADVQTNVDDQNITLTGTVQSEGQHQRVLALVEHYSRYRQVVDKIAVK
jgi:osmotically-inducible protein OsmY